MNPNETHPESKAQMRQHAARSRKTTHTVIWTVVIVVVVAGIFGLTRLDTRGHGGGTASAVATITESDWKKGSPDADVVLIEYGDFQCPACAAYHPLVSQLADEFSEELLVVYRHFPLRQIHPRAQRAAEFTEAAGLQGAFWEMHDLLFENQEDWARSSDVEDLFFSYAESLELNMEQFRVDVDSDAVTERVNEDFDGGRAARISGTPSFFLNGEKIDNPRSLEEFRLLIEAARTDASAMTQDSDTPHTPDTTNQTQ